LAQIGTAARASTRKHARSSVSVRKARIGGSTTVRGYRENWSCAIPAHRVDECARATLVLLGNVVRRGAFIDAGWESRRAAVAEIARHARRVV